MKVFVIVDMQASYVAAQNPALVDAIEREGRETLREGGRVLVVNFDGSGAETVTLPEGVPRIWKEADDGGDLVYSWLIGAGLVDRNLDVRFAGVNLSACVFKTAASLSSRLYVEHAICSAVEIAVDLTGDGGRFKVRFVTGRRRRRATRRGGRRARK